MIRYPFPWQPFPPLFYMLLLMPDPDIVHKYGKITAFMLRQARKAAIKKGHNHKEILKRLL